MLAPSPASLTHNLGEALGRIKMELFADVTPKTAENFRQFCTGEAKDHQGKAIGYKGSKIHRVVSLTTKNLFHATNTSRSLSS